MTRALSLAAVSCAAALTAGILATPAAAQDLTQLNATCSQARGEASLTACNKILAGNHYQGRNLAIIYYTRAVTYHNLQNYQAAIRDYSEAIRVSPDYFEPWHQRANANITTGNYDAAIADEDQATRLKPGEAAAFHYRGMAYQYKANYDRAIADFDVAIRLSPTYPEAYRDRGGSYFSKAMYDRALIDQSEVIRLKPNDFDGWHRRGLTYLWKADLDRAIADFDKTIQLNPTLGAVRRDRGNAFFRKGNYQRALVDADESVRLDPSALNYHHRAVTHFFLENWDKALADFSETLKRDPNNASAYRDRGNTYLKKKQYDLGLADYEASIRANPTYAEAWDAKGVALAWKNDYKGAVAAYDEALRLNPKLAYTLANRASAKDTLGDKNGAYRDATEALQVDPNNQSAKDTRERVRAALGNPSDVVIAEKKTAPIDPVIEKKDQPPVVSGNRVALVIGNSEYRFATKLSNPTNDATDIAAKLKTLGFQVVEGKNLDRSGMDTVIREFSRKLDNASLALFFYAGHGMQVGGKNYLVPVDAKLERPGDLNLDAVDVSLVLQQMEAEKRINLIFLDACRDNPLSRSFARSLGTRSTSVGQGLAPIQSAVGTMIVYATQPENVAFDGEGRNSPFTTALLKHISTPGLDIEVMMRKVRVDVLAATREKQVPWNHSSLTDSVILAQ